MPRSERVVFPPNWLHIREGKPRSSIEEKDILGTIHTANTCIMNVFACWRAIRKHSAWRVNPYTVLACNSAYPLYALCSEDTGPENPVVHFHLQSGAGVSDSTFVRSTAHRPVYSVRRVRVRRIPNITSRDYRPLDLSTVQQTPPHGDHVQPTS
jgi:hypothetical protein